MQVTHDLISYFQKGKCQQQFTRLEIQAGSAPNLSEQALYFGRWASVLTVLAPAAVIPTPTTPQALCVLTDFQREGNEFWGLLAIGMKLSGEKPIPTCMFLTP